MCQLGVYVWMASQYGMPTVVNATTLSIVHQTENIKLDYEDLVEMVTIDSQGRLLALAYKSGVITFLTLQPSFAVNINDLSPFTVDIVFTILVSGPQLCTVEVYNNDLWCGCDLNTLKVISFPHGNSQPYMRRG